MSRQPGGFRIRWYHGVILVCILIIAGVIVIGVEIKLPDDGVEPTVIYTAPDGTQFKCPPGSYNDYLTYMYANFPGQIPEDIEPPPTELRPASAVQFQSRDYITKAEVTTGTTTADFCRANSAGVFNLLNQEDTLTVSSTPDQGAVFLADGDQIIVRLDCTGDPTGGTDYYSGWYYCVLHEGNPVYYLTEDMLTQKTANPYTYTVSAVGAEDTGYVVAFTSGTTNYWDIGQLYLYPRINNTNFDTYFIYRSVTLASITAYNSTNCVDTDAEITANATLQSTTELAYFEVFAEVNNVGWGWNELIVTKQGQLKVYKPVLMMSTGMTGISSSTLASYGWQPIIDSTLTAEKAFYKIMEPQWTTKGSKFDFKVTIPIDSEAAIGSTAYVFKLWCIDIQFPSMIAGGSSSTSIPTAYGFVTAYGPSVMILPRAYTTSAGAGATEILRAYFTTP